MKTYRYYTKKWMMILVSLVSILSCFFKPIISLATNESPAGVTGFTYSITFPENQLDKELGYYHLKMKPGEHQQLAISLSNPSKENVIIDVKLNGAKTNQNGVIEYGESTIGKDSSLKFDFPDIVKAPESVELAPGETKNLELDVTMPETGYDGLVTGGIQLMRKDQNKPTSSSGGSKIVNQYAYVVAVVLQETEMLITPNLALNSIKADQSNYRNTIFINFSNVMATYVDDMTVEVQITEKGKESVLYERKQTAMRMAPNSFIDFPVSMNGERMVPGEYEADILVTSGEKKWAWKEGFKITDEEANKFNERDMGLVQEKGFNWQLIVLVAIGFILLILGMFFLIRFLRKKKQKKGEITKKREKQKKKKNARNKHRKETDN